MATESFVWDGVTFALVVHPDPDQEGVNFLTDDSNSIQLATMTHPQGAQVQPHFHRNIPRTIDQTQEVLFITKGRVSVDFYSTEGRLLGETVLSTGDTILLMAGGHGIRMLEPTQMIEVKQGPYYGSEEDKTWLDAH